MPTALLATLLICTACATPQPIARARAELRGGDADAALATLSEAEVPRRDQLLLLLDRGLAAQAAGRYRESIEALDEADALVERLDYISVRDQGSSLFVSDRVSSYRGESAERLWIHTFQMINFLALGEAEGAAVEARRAVRELEEHEDTFAADPVTRLLAAMSFEAAGQIDGASVEYRRLVGEGEGETLVGTPDGVLRAAWLNARRTARPDVATRLAAAMSEEERIAARRTLDSHEGELVVLLADGFVPPKRAGDLFVSTDLRIAFPYYPEGYTYPVPNLGVRVDGERVLAVSVSTRLVDVARAALAERGKRIAARQALRAATKYNIAHAAESRDRFAGELLRALFFVIEQADTRGWESLPATLSLVQIPLPPGTHDVDVSVDGANTRTYRLTLEDVSIRAGRRTFRSLRPGIGGTLDHAARPD